MKIFTSVPSEYSPSQYRIYEEQQWLWRTHRQSSRVSQIGLAIGTLENVKVG